VPGLVYAPALAGWLVLLGWLRWSGGAPGARAHALALWICAALAVSLVPLYFVGLTTTVQGRPEPMATLKAMVSFLAQGFGPASPAFKPVSYLVVFAIGASGVVVLLLALRSGETASRERALALLFFLAGAVGLALSVGVARPEMQIFPPRYYLQAVPALVCIYLAWDLLGRPRAGALVRTLLVVAALACSGLNYAAALDYARMRAHGWTAFAEDLRQGLPPSVLIARHQRTHMPFPEGGGAYFHGGLAQGMDTLRRAGVGLFAGLTPEGPLREVPIADLAAAEADGAATHWHFDPPVHLLGLRLVPRGSFTDEAIVPYGTVAWRPAAAEFTSARRYHWWTDEPVAWIWIDDEVGELRVEIERPAGDLGPPTIVLLFADHVARVEP